MGEHVARPESGHDTRRIIVSDAFSAGRFDDGDDEGETFRDALRRLAAFVHEVLSALGGDEDIRKKSRYIAMCRLCGMPEFTGMSIRALAKQHDFTPAAISGECIELTERLSFPTWRHDDLHRKSADARKKYAAARTGKRWFKNPKPNDLPAGEASPAHPGETSPATPPGEN